MIDISESDIKSLLMTLAHEINIPLTGIIADAENLAVALKEKDSELCNSAEHLLNSAQRLIMQSNTIMGVFTGHQSGEFRKENIFRPLKEACSMFENEANHKRLTISGPKSINSKFPIIEMSLFDLSLAFKNIIYNAVKYSYYSYRNKEKELNTILVTGYWKDKDHKNYNISVQNYGVGISQDEIDNRLIFNQYYRGRDNRRTSGAGLGLAYASQIIEQMHHGKIDITSKHINDEVYLTNFIITIPVQQPENPNNENKNE